MVDKDETCSYSDCSKRDDDNDCNRLTATTHDDDDDDDDDDESGYSDCGSMCRLVFQLWSLPSLSTV